MHKFRIDIEGEYEGESVRIAAVVEGLTEKNAERLMGYLHDEYGGFESGISEVTEESAGDDTLMKP